MVSRRLCNLHGAYWPQPRTPGVQIGTHLIPTIHLGAQYALCPGFQLPTEPIAKDIRHFLFLNLVTTRDCIEKGITSDSD